MSNTNWDFSGWATINDVECADGRTIRRDAFAGCDKKVVPLVWNHQHNSVENILGHALLENHENGVYCRCKFNDSPSGRDGLAAVQNGDIRSLSIFANKLRQRGKDVVHGAIKEVSLVIAGANPGALIDTVAMAHSESGDEEEAVIYSGQVLVLEHSDDDDKIEEEAENKEESEEENEMNNENDEQLEHAEGAAAATETAQDVFNTLSPKQQNVVYAMIGMALSGEKPDSEKEDKAEKKDDSEEGTDNNTVKHSEGGEEMKNNIFDQNNQAEDQNVLSHAEEATIISDAKRFGSLKDSFLAHADEYGITNIDYLFPDARTITNQPEFIKRETSWVAKVMNGTHHTPFSRIKSMFANITEDEARAKGYIKGNLKKEEVFTLLKRTTDPQTIYKKQKLDRDDIIDITDFDVVAWLKSEMRIMLDEEIAGAILVGDGRSTSDEDKIQEVHIRPIVNDSALYTIQATYAEGADEQATAKAQIKALIRARKNYRGSGNPVAFITESTLCEMLLVEDGIGHLLYDSEAKLATALRVKELIPVPDEIFARSEKKPVIIVVNLNDYNVGADKGGAVSLFDDFDIDYNQQKYLIETRCSGALTKPYSAIVLSKAATAAGSNG